MDPFRTDFLSVIHKKIKTAILKSIKQPQPWSKRLGTLEEIMHN